MTERIIEIPTESHSELKLVRSLHKVPMQQVSIVIKCLCRVRQSQPLGSLRVQDLSKLFKFPDYFLSTILFDHPFHEILPDRCIFRVCFGS